MMRQCVRAVYIFVVVFVTGCSPCGIAICDRRVHVSGRVLDQAGRPLADANVELFGLEKKTDINGCFFFNGIIDASRVPVSVFKAGYRSYRDSDRFEYYDITVTLQTVSSIEKSSGGGNG
jgi:hypothetical protein